MDKEHDSTQVADAPRESKKKVHFHLYLDQSTADWLRQEREDNFMPVSASVALAVREYRKNREG